MSWEQELGQFATEAGQLAFLVAFTGLLYRLMRMKWPDVPEAVLQVLAAILSTAVNLSILWKPDLLLHQWLLVGISRGILRSQNIIKSIDWISAAKNGTGAPSLGIPERPPQWYIDLHPELFPAPPTPLKPPATAAPVVTTPTVSSPFSPPPGKPTGWE